MAKKKECQIPPDLLERINEFSSGGYLIFTFDVNGYPRLSQKFDSAMHLRCMYGDVGAWAKAIEMVNVDKIAEAIDFNSKRK